ncbi:MAG: hypothetical protein AAB863_03475, partial [Patescibacteria group bacterium]
INQLVDDMPKGSVDLKGVNKILQNNNITTQDIEPNKEAEYYVELLKKVKDGVDTAPIKTATEALSTAMQKIGEEMSKQSQTEENKPEENPNPEDKKE